MLDALVRHLVQEIGFQGTVGIHPDKIAGLAQGFFDAQAQAHLAAAAAGSSTASAPGRRRSAAQLTQVLDPPYISYLLGVLLEHDDVLLSVGSPPEIATAADASKADGRQARHEVSREEYAEVGLDALRVEHGPNLAIRLTDDAACLIVAGQRREYVTFSDLTLSILSTISSKGPEGVSGVALSRQYSLAPKDTFYHTKKLVNEGLIFKMGSTEEGTHTSHFTHRRFVSLNDGPPMASHFAQQPELDRRFLNNYEYLEPKAMAVFEAQPKGVLRTLQIWGKDGFLLRQMGYRGRIDMNVSRLVKRLIRALVACGKLRRINVRNTTAARLKGLLAAYQAMSYVDGGDASEAEVEVPGGELGLDDSQVGDQKPLVGDEGTADEGMAVVFYDPSEASLEPPSRFEPVTRISPSTPVDYQVLQFILEGGKAGRTYKDVMRQFAYSRRFIEWLSDRWSPKEGTPPHLPQTSIVQVTDQVGKERRLILFGTSSYRALCQQLGHPIDPAVCPPEDPAAAGGFLSLDDFELWDEPQQRVEWAESYPLENFRSVTLGPKDLLPFLPISAGEGERLNKKALRALLGYAASGEWLGTFADKRAKSTPNGVNRVPGKVNGPQKAMIARLQRIVAGDEATPAGAAEYRLMAKRAASIGLTLPPRPVTPGKHRRSSSVTSYVASAAVAGPSQSPAPNAVKRKRGRPAASTDGEVDEGSASSTGVKTPARKKGPAKTPRRSTLSQSQVTSVAPPSPPSVLTGSEGPRSLVPSAPLPLPLALAVDGADTSLSEAEARPRKIRRKSTPAQAVQPLPPPPPLEMSLPPVAASRESLPLEPALSAASASTEDTLVVEPRPPPSPQERPSTAVETPGSSRPSRKRITHMLPRTSEVQATPTAKLRRGKSEPAVVEDMSAEDASFDGPTALSGTAAPLAVTGPSAFGIVLPLMPTTDSPDFMVNGPAPPIEDARARLRRKQQEAEAARAARRKLRKEVVELDLGVDVLRSENKNKNGSVKDKSKPSGLPRKERSDKGKRRGERAGQWIFPTESEKKERAQRAAKKAAAAGAATEEAVAAAAAAQKAAEAAAPPPPSPIDHNYVAVILPEDEGLIPNIVNQVGRTAGSDAQRHRTRHNDELDDVIMDIGSIVSVRGSAPGYMYSWGPALRIIKGVTTTTIRNRFHKLQDKHGSYIYQLQSAYQRMWNAVGKTPLLPEDPKHKRGEFDIHHHLRFFRKNIDKAVLRTNADVSQVEGEQESRVPDLPGHISAMAALKLEDNVNVVADAFDYSWLHVPKQTLSDDLSELASRNNLYLIEPSSAARVGVTNAGRREDSVLASTVKMVCSTRDADFDPRQADAVLPKTGRSGEIIRDLILEGVCDSRSDEVNGRIGFTEQFKAFSAGPHAASFFTEAAEVESSIPGGGLLIKEEHTLWPLLASDGHTAALLHLSSGNRIELETEQEDLQTLCAGVTLRNSKKLDDEALEFHISARLTDGKPDNPTDAHVPPSFDLDNGPIALDVEARAAVLASLTEDDPVGLMAIGKRIVEYLDLPDIGGDGATWSITQALCPELSFLELVQLSLTLAETTPPLLFVTGYDAPRLVSTLFIPSWVAFVPTTSQRLPLPDEAAEEIEPDSEPSKVMVWPRRWVDMNAHVVESDWDGCVRLVVGCLLDRSGITEAALRRMLLPVLDRLEMSEILRHLLQLRMAQRVVYPASSLSPLAVPETELADWPIGWLGPDEEHRVGWELVGGAWIEGLDEQQGLV